MNLKYLPENFKKAIYELTEDEEFQKIYGEDKVLDDLLEQEEKAE